MIHTLFTYIRKQIITNTYTYNYSWMQCFFLCLQSVKHCTIDYHNLAGCIALHYIQ